MTTPTRSELIELKHKVLLAKKGHSLLKRKQDALIREFLMHVQDYKKRKIAIHEQVVQTYKALSLDLAYTGIFVSRSFSYAVLPCFTLHKVEKNLLGVRIPQLHVKRTRDTEVAHFEGSPLLAEATRKFQHLFQELIALASMEMKIKAMAEEIKKTKRRVNSLEHIQIPNMQDTVDWIKFVLNEQERDNFSRLKSLKKKMDNA